MNSPVIQHQFSYTCLRIKKSDPNLTENYSCIYSPYKKHRDDTAGKSQWVDEITEEIEFALFQQTLRNEWVRQEPFKYNKKKYSRLLSPNGRGWGLSLVDGKPETLGTLIDETDVKVCVFEEGNPNLWHGYPADLKKKQDRPLDHVLKKWREAKYISKSLLNKVKSGKIRTI